MTLDDSIKLLGAKWLKPEGIVKLMNELDQYKKALDLCKLQRNSFVTLYWNANLVTDVNKMSAGEIQENIAREIKVEDNEIDMMLGHPSNQLETL